MPLYPYPPQQKPLYPDPGVGPYQGGLRPGAGTAGPAPPQAPLPPPGGFAPGGPTGAPVQLQSALPPALPPTQPQPVPWGGGAPNARPAPAGPRLGPPSLQRTPQRPPPGRR
jgi:hypothetical protein